MVISVQRDIFAAAPFERAEMDALLKTEIEVIVLDQRLKCWGLPCYQTEMAAAVDLHACLDGALTLKPGTSAQLIPSGIAIHIANPNLAAVIVPRSGLGHKKGLVLGNLTGVIDADYMGPVMISVWNRNALGTAPIVIQPGERIAQMVFIPIARVSFTTVDEFSNASGRGVAGFGSTGSVA
jgi:dUTP pyrophosphatase